MNRRGALRKLLGLGAGTAAAVVVPVAVLAAEEEFEPAAVEGGRPEWQLKFYGNPENHDDPHPNDIEFRRAKDGSLWISRDDVTKKLI